MVYRDLFANDQGPVTNDRPVTAEINHQRQISNDHEQRPMADDQSPIVVIGR